MRILLLILVVLPGCPEQRQSRWEPYVMPYHECDCIQYSDGAVAIVCDECLGKPIRQVCHGYPASKGRIEIEQLPPGRFSHIQEMHERDEMGI